MPLKLFEICCIKFSTQKHCILTMIINRKLNNEILTSILLFLARISWKLKALNMSSEDFNPSLEGVHDVPWLGKCCHQQDNSMSKALLSEGKLQQTSVI